MRKNKIKCIQEIFLFIFILFISIPCYASMQLYISNDCENCKLVMQQGKEAIQRLKDREGLEVVDVTNIETDLPALPALVDGEKVIIGTGLLKHLADEAEVEFSGAAYQMLDDCPECD